VQRDLLPLIEGNHRVDQAWRRHKTDHILFIAFGCVSHRQAVPICCRKFAGGRLPIRVELEALTRDDMRRILTEPEASLIKQIYRR